MTTITHIRDRNRSHPITGDAIQRSFKIEGITNTAGEPEVYELHIDGVYNNGKARVDVFVERSNGGFSMLNCNRHHQRIRIVTNAARAEIAEYEAECKA